MFLPLGQILGLGNGGGRRPWAYELQAPIIEVCLNIPDIAELRLPLAPVAHLSHGLLLNAVDRLELLCRPIIRLVAVPLDVGIAQAEDDGQPGLRPSIGSRLLVVGYRLTEPIEGVLGEETLDLALG